jgi:hypothetical protein
MDGLTIKPRDGASRVGQSRQTASVRTELAPSQSVTAAAPSATARPGEDHGGPHDYHLDGRSQSVIDDERDLAKRRPRRPQDEALSRMRAYNRALSSNEDEPESESHADLKA